MKFASHLCNKQPQRSLLKIVSKAAVKSTLAESIASESLINDCFKPMPRQSSQSSAKASANQKVTPKAGSGSKTLTKKPSDLGSKTGTATRKSSQASKKTDSSIKVHLDSSR